MMRFYINKYGSMHTDAIVADDNKAIDKFKLINSSSVMVNTSTRLLMDMNMD